MPTPAIARPSTSLVLDLATHLAACYGEIPLVAAASEGLHRRPRRRGAGMHVGLIETALDPSLPDLAGASFSVADFGGTAHPAPAIVQHGTYSASLLIGQGHRDVIGLVPRAHLWIALVAGSSGAARPSAVARALDWLSTRRMPIAVPLGSTAWDADLAAAIERASARGARVLAAAGNLHPGPVLFPACHASAIAVGAVDGAGRLARDSCRWPALDIVAPGIGIPGADGEGLVQGRSGSSVACVLAAGLLCLSASNRSPPS